MQFRHKETQSLFYAGLSFIWVVVILGGWIHLEASIQRGDLSWTRLLCYLSLDALALLGFCSALRRV